MPPGSEVPYGPLDLLTTLDSLGPLHGFGIARRIEQVVDGALALNQGRIYPALLRLERKCGCLPGGPDRWMLSSP